MVAIIKENIRMRGLNLGSEKTGFNECLDQNMKEGSNKVQTLIKRCSMGQMQKFQTPTGSRTSDLPVLPQMEGTEI
jgi:hypothetical protein